MPTKDISFSRNEDYSYTLHNVPLGDGTNVLIVLRPWTYDDRLWVAENQWLSTGQRDPIFPYKLASEMIIKMGEKTSIPWTELHSNKAQYGEVMMIIDSFLESHIVTQYRFIPREEEGMAKGDLSSRRKKIPA
ncbi:MAG: hypothetical protein F6J98_02165 [Moorea sp. SIO4G2]|nr:hypothetical protein [Moorena sp. SIO4G2]